MAVSEPDKVRARAHMGYLGVNQGSTFVLGIPAAVQTQFVIENAWSKIIPAAEYLFRKYLDRLDMIEQQIVDDTEDVAVDKIDEIELRKDEFAQLIKRYQHWQGALANLLGVPPNPFDQRPWLGSSGGGGINVSVHH